jgi:hypothetical protein
MLKFIRYFKTIVEVKMGKKLYIYLFSILLLLVFSLSAMAKIGIELRGGLALINPDEYNAGVHYTSDAFNNHGFINAFNRIYSGNGPLFNDLPQGVTGTSLSQMFDGGANLNIFLGDSFAIKLRGDALYNEYDDIVTIDGIDCLYSHTILMLAYAGAGVSYYFNLSPNLSFFLSADGGMFLNLNSFYEVGSFSDASDKLNLLNIPQGAYSVDFKDSFFGGHGEAGVQVLLSEGFGISLFGGYRYGVMPIAFPNNGDVALVNSTGPTQLTKTAVFNATTIDISGIYFGAGINLYFGADKLPASGGSGAAAAAAAGGTTKYEQYGNYYFKQKNYKYALSYYNGAYKLSPNPKLLKQMGYCYYYMKDMNKALEYLQKYLATNPDDPAIINWVKTLQK